MSLCRDIGGWITDNVEKPLNNWRNNAWQECTEARRWLEENRKRIESWWRTQRTRCLEQPCQWLCLCCNKWFCWLIDVVLSILTITLQIIEHVVEAVCKLIVMLIWWLTSILVQIVKWAVLLVVCLLEASCALFVLLGALALLAFLLAVAAQGVASLAPVAAPWIPVSISVAIGALAIARLLCEVGRCRLLGAIVWALKWAIVLGAALAAIMLSPVSAWFVTVYGAIIASLMHLLKKIGCQPPRMLGLP